MAGKEHNTIIFTMQVFERLQDLADRKPLENLTPIWSSTSWASWLPPEEESELETKSIIYQMLKEHYTIMAGNRQATGTERKTKNYFAKQAQRNQKNLDTLKRVTLEAYKELDPKKGFGFHHKRVVLNLLTPKSKLRYPNRYSLKYELVFMNCPNSSYYSMMASPDIKFMAKGDVGMELVRQKHKLSRKFLHGV